MENNKVAEEGVSKVRVSDLKELLKWKLFWSKESSKATRKQDLVLLWEQHPLPAAEEEWTEMDEACMECLKTAEVYMHHTEVGEEHAKSAAALVGGIKSGDVAESTIEQLEVALYERRQRRARSLPTSTNEDSTE